MTAPPAPPTHRAGGGLSGAVDKLGPHKVPILVVGGAAALGGIALLKRSSSSSSATPAAGTTGQTVPAGGYPSDPYSAAQDAYNSLEPQLEALQSQIAGLSSTSTTPTPAPAKTPAPAPKPAATKTPPKPAAASYYALSPAAAANALNNLGYTLYQTGAEALAYDKAHGTNYAKGVNPAGYYALSPAAAKAGLASGLVEYQTAAEAAQWNASHGK